MRAARCHQYGPPDGLVIEEVPDPEPGPGEALVDVHAAAVNFPDVLVMAGTYQVRAPLPFTPGSEFAGVVRAVGEGVRSVAPGDRVSGALFVGAFAERVAMPAAGLTPVGAGVDLRAAAAFGVAHTTAYAALRSVARVQPGEWVVVLGAAGGVGLAAVELAAALGARVLAAASSAEKLKVCLDRGAEAAVDYTTEDLKERIRAVTGGAGVVIDPVGGPYAEPALRALGWGGRFVTVGYASGEIPRIPLNLVLLKGISVLGFEMRQFQQHHGDEDRRNRAELLAMLERGELAPHVSAVHPLDDAAGALMAVAGRRSTGKVLIDPRA